VLAELKNWGAVYKIETSMKVANDEEFTYQVLSE